MSLREDLMWGPDHRTGSACRLSLAVRRYWGSEVDDALEISEQTGI
jgi:hypothetical protein